MGNPTRSGLYFRRLLPKKEENLNCGYGVEEGKKMLIWIVAGITLCVALGFVATELRTHHH